MPIIWAFQSEIDKILFKEERKKEGRWTSDFNIGVIEW